ncbi:AAA family ATPase [Flavobacterium procerum]|uniref:AAA family ATPase n=1 Tax=Flavobacterium procerum TaxID=1455569 RepID=A0ABV6BVP9_9FLAO
MIKLNRPEKPEFLYYKKIDKEIERIENFIYSTSQARIKYNTQLLSPLRKILVDIVHNKCAYCETKTGIASSMQIDHFRPKNGAVGLDKEYSPDHYFWLAYDWENLIPSCQICSVNKRNIFPIEEHFERVPIMTKGELLREERALLIDPFFDNPSEYLHFSEDGYVMGINHKGKITIQVLNLNRKPLVEARRNAARELTNEMNNFDVMTQNLKKEFLLKTKEIFSEYSKYEYSAVLRTVLSRWLPKPYYIELQINEKHIPTDESFIKSKEHSSIQIDRFTIKSIEISNFKSIERLVLNFVPANDLNDRESWLLMLGDNGVGKSAILQAIAMTLCGPEEFARLDLNPKDLYKRDAEGPGFVKIFSYEREDPYELHFDADAFFSKPETAPSILLAYGATRLLPKGNLQPHNAEPSLVNIANMFDYSLSLVDAQRWILDQSEENFEERIIPVLIDLLDIKGKIKFIRSASELFLGNVRLSEISDGYKSMIAMACDIMQSLSLHRTHFHETAGLVLIDELGNHLHPKWRLRIVSSLRMAFPKLQFIVSTHEPLCLRGLDHGEVIVLITDEKRNVTALDCKMLPDHNLLRIDQLLTSDLFGLLDTTGRETEIKFQYYYRLLLKPEKFRTEAENEEIDSISKTLYDNELIGSTPQIQALFKLLNENYAKNIIKNGFQTKEKLKQDTIEEVQKIINEKNLDWL